mgnify:CR=1 FL=1
MSTHILYDVRDKSIVRAQTIPYGVDMSPTKSALLLSARVPEDEYNNYDVLVYEGGDYLTTKAKEQLRIVEKPTLKLIVNGFEVSVIVTNTLIGETFNSITLQVDDVPINVPLTDNQGSITLEFTDPGTYTITCNDERFQPVPPVTLEVV